MRSRILLLLAASALVLAACGGGSQVVATVADGVATDPTVAARLAQLADLLAAAVNPNVGAWTLSPMASEIEGQTVRWIAELIGYPTDCGGLMVSGGNQANFVAFLAARAAAGFRWRIRETGLTGPGSSPLRVYCSHETHTWIEKAADLFGIFYGALAGAQVVILAAGTGNPFFTTDTAASLRAIEIGADVLLKATKVDGVYDSDPVDNPDARRYDSVDFDTVLSDKLRVMDATAIVMCRDNGLPLRVFDLTRANALVQAMTGDSVHRRTSGVAMGQAAGLSTTKSRPARAARMTPQRRCR